MRMIRRIITGALCCILPACATVCHARGETAAVLPQHIRLAEHAVIEAANLPLYEYSVTLRDFLSGDPGEFHSGKILKTEHYESEYAIWDNIDTFTFEDGYTLTRSGTDLCLGNRDHEKYSQLLVYMDNTDAPVPEDEPFPLQEAQERCNRIISQLDIGYLEPEQAVPLTNKTIQSLTKELKEFYSGHKLACFDTFPEETGAWCLTFRQKLGGIDVTNLTHTPQVRIILTKDETALLEIESIIDTIDKAEMLPEGTSPEDALRYFTEEYPEGEKKDRRESFRISRIVPAYCTNGGWETGKVPVKERLSPCWRIESVMTLETSNGTRDISMSELYRIPDGEKVKPIVIEE